MASKTAGKTNQKSNDVKNEQEQARAQHEQWVQQERARLQNLIASYQKSVDETEYKIQRCNGIKGQITAAIGELTTASAGISEAGKGVKDALGGERINEINGIIADLADSCNTASSKLGNETIKVDAYIKHLQQVKENANEWLTKYRTQLANIS